MKPNISRTEFPVAHSEFESLELLLEAPKVPDDELAVAGRGGELVRPILVARHDLDGTGKRIQQFYFKAKKKYGFAFPILI